MKTKMKTTFLLWLFPLLLFLVAHAADPGKDSDLKCSQRTEAELGKDVTLDCYCEPRCHVTGEILEWRFNQNTFVLAYRGDYYLNQQDVQFKGRAHVTSTESLLDGNFPVTISKIRKSDEGNYTCRVESKTFHVGSKTCSVELQLKADKGARIDEKTSEAGGGNTTPSTTSYDGLQRGRQQNERGPPQNDQEDVALQGDRPELSQNAGE